MELVKASRCSLATKKVTTTFHLSTVDGLSPQMTKKAALFVIEQHNNNNDKQHSHNVQESVRQQSTEPSSAPQCSTRESSNGADGEGVDSSWGRFVAEKIQEFDRESEADKRESEARARESEARARESEARARESAIRMAEIEECQREVEESIEEFTRELARFTGLAVTAIENKNDSRYNRRKTLSQQTVDVASVTI